MMSEITNSMAIGIVFNLPTQWHSKGGGKWGHLPRDAVLGGESTHLIQPFKNEVLSRNLDRPKYA